MEAHRMRFVGACVLVLALTSDPSAAQFYPPDTGVVCLDQTTGEPIWEFFPEKPTYSSLATDGTAVLLIDGPLWTYVKDGTEELRSKLKVTRIDLNTGWELTVRTPPQPLADPGDLTTTWSYPGTLVTASGDRVVGGSNGDRAITVMKGDSNIPRWIISVGRRYDHLFVHGDTVIYAPSYWNEPAPVRPTVVAVDANTNDIAWSIDRGDHALGLGLGSRYVYVCEHKVIHALQPHTGRVIWHQELPRMRRQATVRERDGRVFVAGKIVPTEEDLYYLYCLDEATGEVEWTYDPAGPTQSWLPLLFHDGKVYTRIAPTSLVADWRKQGSAQRDHVIQRFVWKSPEEIELHLRAFHALGDRSALPVLAVAAEGLRQEDLRGLAAELIRAFPRVRNSMALVEFLSGQFDGYPDLRVEIGRILYQFDPIPHRRRRYTQVSSCGGGRVRFPKFPVRPEQKPLLDAYNSLKGRVDGVPVVNFTYDDIRQLAWHRGFGPFESLVAAHDESTNADTRRLMRRALFLNHPAAAAEWAFQHMDTASPGDRFGREKNPLSDWFIAPEYPVSGWWLTDTYTLSVWAEHAPMDWLLAHEDLLLGWLQPGMRSVQYALARRIRELEDPRRVLSICVRLLEADWDGIDDRKRGGLFLALEVIAKCGSAEHIPLVRPYAEDPAAVRSPLADTRPPNQQHRDYRLRSAATGTLRALGVKMPDVAPPPRRSRSAKKDQRDLSPYDRVQRLYSRMWQAQNRDDEDAARDAARGIVDLTGGDPEFVSVDYGILRRAYEVLEEWDKAIAIELARGEALGDPGSTEKDRLPLLIRAGRLDEAQNIMTHTRSRENATHAALLLIATDRVDKAFEFLSMQLEDNPNYADACIGLAMIHFERKEFAESDSMMERAIALRPAPMESPFFPRTITYWLDRGQPEKAKAWLRESARNHPLRWTYEGLFEWAAQFPELETTVREFTLTERIGQN